MQGTIGSPATLKLRNLLVALSCVCLVSAGCTTPRALGLDPPPVAADEDVAPGRAVIVVLHDGSEIRAKIAAADADGLTLTRGSYRQPRYVSYGDMRSLKVRDLATGRTVVAVIGGTLLVAAGVLVHLIVENAQNSD